MGRSKKDLFSALLHDDAKQLLLKPVLAEKDALMDRQGKLGGIYTFTWPALAQVCSAMGNGLYTLCKDLSERTNVSRPQAVLNAAEVYNRLVKLSFDQIKDTRFVVTRSRATVDGHIGRSFVMVYNQRVFEAAVEIATNISSNMFFADGTLIGRDMNVAFSDLSSKGMVADVNGIKFYRGLLVQNRETGGRAIRLANVLFDTHTRSYSVDRFYKDTRIPHIAPSKLVGKMMQLSDAVIVRQKRKEEVGTAVSKATNMRLMSSWSQEAKEALCKRLTAKLTSVEIPNYVAEGVIGKLTAKNNQVPSLFDLYTAMLQSANVLSDGMALRLRQAAFDFIF